MRTKDECGYCRDLCPVAWWCACDCGIEPERPAQWCLPDECESCRDAMTHSDGEWMW